VCSIEAVFAAHFQRVCRAFPQVICLGKLKDGDGTYVIMHFDIAASTLTADDIKARIPGCVSVEQTFRDHGLRDGQAVSIPVLLVEVHPVVS